MTQRRRSRLRRRRAGEGLGARPQPPAAGACREAAGNQPPPAALGQWEPCGEVGVWDAAVGSVDPADALTAAKPRPAAA